MPRAGPKSDTAVVVELDRPDGVFRPGDTVSGRVTVASPSPTNGSTNNIHITIFGRSKVLMVRSRGQSRDYYRGRAVLFEHRFYLDGPPVSRADGTETWQFSTQLPTHTVPVPKSRWSHDTWKKNDKFLDNVNMDVRTHPLPGVFYYRTEFGGDKSECYVEYVLKASLHTRRVEDDGTDSDTKKKPKKNESGSPKTVVPLAVRARSTDQPILYDAHMQDLREDTRIRTLRLLPTFATETQLGFMHNIRSVLKPSSVPAYFFDTRISYPATVQLDNPNCFPFRLSVIPKASGSGSSSGSIFDGGSAASLPDVKLMTFSLSLRVTVLMRARTLLKWDTSTEKHHDFVIVPALPPHLVGYVIPREGEPIYDHANGAAGEQSLDVGRLLDLRVSRTHSTWQSATSNEPTRTDFKAKRPLWASFKSYNIHVWYEWKYKMSIMCVGERETIEGRQRVQLIGQSEEQVQNVAVDNQGVRKGWGELMDGVVGLGQALAGIGVLASEAAE
ncbi:hypothetical protein DRE_04682 [Drechslerella stenobrocha 248]|uniref:Arrestin-like N-terminal domain-containing protein n=1 Tax=Drechslerella stenobrocha 248 TaxID=1043628 RepID=W7I1K7_9PEZI|nr:hypothetical protein DRE_04682 [Drechslerella stenobrocha 248]